MGMVGWRMDQFKLDLSVEDMTCGSPGSMSLLVIGFDMGHRFSFSVFVFFVALVERWAFNTSPLSVFILRLYQGSKYFGSAATGG